MRGDRARHVIAVMRDEARAELQWRQEGSGRERRQIPEYAYGVRGVVHDVAGVREKITEMLMRVSRDRRGGSGKSPADEV